MGAGARTIANICIFILLFIAPWWLTLVLVCASLFVFENYFEALFFAMLMDGYHGQAQLTFYGINALFTLIISIVFILSIFLKTRLRFYTD